MLLFLVHFIRNQEAESLCSRCYKVESFCMCYKVESFCMCYKVESFCMCYKVESFCMCYKVKSFCMCYRWRPCVTYLKIPMTIGVQMS